MNIVAGALITALLLYAGLCAALFVFQRSLIYFPQPRALGTDHLAVLKTGDADLHLSVRPLPGAGDALIYFGGNAEDVSLSLPGIASAFPTHALYLLHYRGYGGSSGRPSEAALHADALALFDQVVVDHPRVTVVGRSLGTGPAVRLATQRPVHRLVLVTPYDSLTALAQGHYPVVPVRWLLRDRFESVDIADQVTAPTTLVVAQHDQLTPVAGARRLYQRFQPGVARWVLLEGVGHNTIAHSPGYLPALNGRALQ
ncbi:MAG TPA: alpha/beta hydrolase [Rubrivivax sp.]|nr:alpha/beta hydrolase [Rubrivivax sp.]